MLHGFKNNLIVYCLDEQNSLNLPRKSKTNKSHRQKINNILYVNPGSVAQPRGKYDIKMYAIIEIDGDEFIVSYRNLQHEPIPELQFRL